MPAADAARQLRGQGLGRPEAGYGRKRSFRGADGGFAPAERLPEVRRHRVAGTRGIVRVEPAGPATLVDGSADGLTALAAFGALPRDRPLAYAADRDARSSGATPGPGPSWWSPTPTAGACSCPPGCARTPARRWRPATRSARTRRC